jgi:hypothetical protein
MQPTTITLALALLAGTALAGRDKSKAFPHSYPAQPPHPVITVPVESIALPLQSVAVPVENIIVPAISPAPVAVPAMPVAGAGEN